MMEYVWLKEVMDSRVVKNGYYFDFVRIFFKIILLVFLYLMYYYSIEDFKVLIWYFFLIKIFGEFFLNGSIIY